MSYKPNIFDIWTAELPLVKGSHIQGGFRPVLVVSNNACNRTSSVISIVPLTSKPKKPNFPTHVVLEGGGLKARSIALCEQLTLIDKKALRKKLGAIVTEASQEAIRKAIAIQLGLQIQYHKECNYMKTMENEMLCHSPLMLTMEALHRAGHSFVPVEELLSRCGMGKEAAIGELEALVTEDLLHLEGDRVSTERVHQAERNAAMALALRLDNNYLPWLQNWKRLPVMMSQEQLQAIQMGLDHSLSLVLGGAGTGKTRVVGGLLAVFRDNQKGNTLLLAPTGRAAANIREATGLKAYTIHRALLSPAKWEDIKLVVVDEASMLTVELLAEILERCPLSCRIVLVGDPDQLQSVGAGNVVQDLLKVGFPAITLRENHRQQGAQSALRRNILDFANITSVSQLAFDDSFCFVDIPDWNVSDIVTQEAIARYRSGEKVQVLTNVNASVDAFNKVIHPAVNPLAENGPYIPNHKTRFWDGDRVLVIQNLKDVGCCNGDVGTLQLYPTERRDAIAALDLLSGSRVYLERQEQMKYLQHGYAMTIHKAQGSAFDTVILPVTWGMRHMLNRNLLYTALSRARVKLLLVGNRDALDYALQTLAPARNSALGELTLWQACA